MSSRNFEPKNRIRSSLNVNKANNSNQNSIGEQEVVSIDSDIQIQKQKADEQLEGLDLRNMSKQMVPFELELTLKIENQFNYFILYLNEPLVQDYLEHEMSVLYRDFHCSLHKSYKKYDSPAEARKHRDKRVARDSDWARLCDRWEQEDFKTISEANSKALSKLPFTHRGGTLTFLCHKQKIKEEGKEVSEIKLFQLMHSNEKNGWVNEAKAKYDEMVELKTTSSQEGSEPLLEREICERQQATIEAILRRLSCQEATSNMKRSSEQSNDSQQVIFFQLN
uniref:CACTA en-spm transposon protein n=1 Tax=Cucumis melo TaxID=3656 RepID=A0A9I9EJ36_CUCME